MRNANIKSLLFILIVGLLFSACQGGNTGNTATTSATGGTEANNAVSKTPESKPEETEPEDKDMDTPNADSASTTSAATTTATSTAASATSTTAALDSSANTLDEVEIIWYLAGSWPQRDQEEVFAEFNRMLKEKINATVDFRALGFGEFDPKIQAVIASGEAYDICFTSNWVNDYLQNVSKNAFMPINDLLETYAPKFYDSIPRPYWGAVTIEEKIYAAIGLQVVASAPAVNTYKYLIDESGYDHEKQYIPGDLLSLEPLFKYIYDTYGGYFLMPDSTGGILVGLEFPGGSTIPVALDLSDGKTIVKIYEFPSYIKFVNDLRYFNSQGYMRSDIRSAYPDDAANTSVAAEQYGYPDEYVYIGGTYMPGYDSMVSSSYEKDGWKTGWPVCTPLVSSSAIQATLTGFNVNARNPERAMMMLELLNLPPQEGEIFNRIFNTLAFGIENKHWSYVESGLRHWIDIDGYCPNNDWGAIGNQFNAVPDETKEPDIYEQHRKYNLSSQVSPIMGFAFDPTPVRTEVANCAGVQTEYSRRIILGTITDAEYNEMVAKYEQSGTDVIVAEMQRQLDAWRASK